MARCATTAPVLMLAAVALGCGGSVPERSSPEKARKALEIALEAWQKAESIEALAKGSSPIYFNDPKVQKGLRLLSYQLEDTHDFFGQSVRISVKATFERDDGMAKERKLTYLVDTTPVVVIVPD